MKRSGYWWQSMGFTRTHVVGVFVTETVLGTLAMGLMGAAFVASSTWLLLAAACLLLLAVTVQLSSILSLMFYRWWRECEPDPQ